MAKLTEVQLKSWLESDEYMIRSQDGKSEEQLFKAPLNDDFTFIYYKRISKNESLGVDENLKNIGLYYKKDGCIYNPSYHLKSMCEETPIIMSHTTKKDFSQQLTAAVKEYVEKVIDNNVNNLDSRKISNEWKLRSVAEFIEYKAKDRARGLFLSDAEVTDIKYQCCCSWDNISDSEYISFITDKDAFVISKADEYVKEKQDDILVQLYENAALKSELQNIYDDNENELYRIKAIKSAVENSYAKIVNITINKDDKEFTFKYDADQLRRDPEGYYYTWGMQSSDEKEFEYFFGKDARFYPKDITQITYCRNVIYDSSEFDVAETEDAAMEQTM